jgi:hypothetical protein
MMLNAVALKSLCAAIIHVNRQRHRHSAFGIHEAIAIVLIDIQVISDDLKLVARHFEHFVVVNNHGTRLEGRLPGRETQLLFALGR